MNIFNDDDIPIGLGMAFAQNLAAMQKFCNLPDSDQKQIVEQARNVTSREELDIIVNDIGKMS